VKDSESKITIFYKKIMEFVSNLHNLIVNISFISNLQYSKAQILNGEQLHLIVIAYLIFGQMADSQYYIKLVFLIKLKLIKLIKV